MLRFLCLTLLVMVLGIAAEAQAVPSKNDDTLFGARGIRSHKLLTDSREESAQMSNVAKAFWGYWVARQV